MKQIVLEMAVFLVAASCDASTVTEVAPSSEEVVFPRCQRYDPNLAECILNATTFLREHLENGIPELNIPSLNPFKLPTIKLQQATKSLQYKAVLTDVNLYGLADYEVFDVKTDMKNLTFEISASFDHVFVDTEYMLMGTYEELPIEGSGRLTANFTDNEAKITLYGAVVKRKDGEYFVNKEIDVSVMSGGAQTDLDSLYAGGDVKSQITDHIIKMHSDDVMEQLKPAIENVISMIIDEITTKFFKSLTFDKLLPEE